MAIPMSDITEEVCKEYRGSCIGMRFLHPVWFIDEVRHAARPPASRTPPHPRRLSAALRIPARNTPPPAQHAAVSAATRVAIRFAPAAPNRHPLRAASDPSAPLSRAEPMDYDPKWFRARFTTSLPCRSS